MIPECIGPILSKNSAQKYQNSARSCAYCSHNSGEVSWLPYSTYFFYFFKGIYGWHTNISFWSKSWRCLIWRFALSKGYRNRIRTTFQLLTLHLASYSSIEKSLILLYLIAWYLHLHKYQAVRKTLFPVKYITKLCKFYFDLLVIYELSLSGTFRTRSWSRLQRTQPFPREGPFSRRRSVSLTGLGMKLRSSMLIMSRKIPSSGRCLQTAKSKFVIIVIFHNMCKAHTCLP